MTIDIDASTTMNIHIIIIIIHIKILLSFKQNSQHIHDVVLTTCKIANQSTKNKIRTMIASQLSRAFLCKGKREGKFSNNSDDRRQPFGTSLFHLFRKTASINNSFPVMNGATTKNDDDDNNDNNNNNNNNNNNKSKARTLSDERCDDGVSTSSILSRKSSAEIKIMMPLENKVKKNEKACDDDTIELSTPSPIPRQIITGQTRDDDKRPHIISIRNVSQLLMPSIDGDSDDGGDSSSSSPASLESIHSLLSSSLSLSSSSSSSALALALASSSSSTGILRLPARQPLGLNEEINNADDFDDLDLWEMCVIPLEYEEEYNRSCRFQTPPPPVLDVIVPNNFDHYTALKQTKDNSSHHNSSNKRRSYLISGPPMRIGEWDHHTIESNPNELLLTNGCDSRIISRTTSSISNITGKALFEPNILYPTSTMTKNTTKFSDNYNRRRRNNKRRAALLQQIQQVQQQQQQSLHSNKNLQWGDVHPRLLSTLNQSQHQSQHQHQRQQQRVVKWNMIHNNSW
jgi:hypothetical protein